MSINNVESVFQNAIAEMISVSPCDIDLTDSLEDYGLDSISQVRLAAIAGDQLGVDIDPALFHDFETVEQIISHLVTMLGGDSKEDKFSFNAECQLPSGLTRMNTPDDFSNLMPRTVLLTGATGFIGGYLLRELLQIDHIKVLCLVRAGSAKQGVERVKNNLKKYTVWEELFSDKFTVVVGDLAKQQFGLSDEDFDSLGKEIDTIFHAGANVNFISSYKQLKTENVNSVHTILELANLGEAHTSQIHFISTLGVVMANGRPAEAVIYEDDELQYDDLPNGYEQSKYVADRTIQSAIKTLHFPASIYRLGLVSADSNSGAYVNTHEFLPSFLKGCLQVNSWPEVDSTLEMVPVDFIVKAIIHIAMNPRNLGKSYFALHPQPTKISDIIDFYKRKGYPLEILPWEEWKMELFRKKTSAETDHALLPFEAFIKALAGVNVFFPTVDKNNFSSAIASLDYRCEDQLHLLERYHQHFTETGYYHHAE